MFGRKPYAQIAHTASQVEVMQVGKLPDLPLPSPELKRLLSKYDQDISLRESLSEISILNEGPPVKLRKRRLNGFMAFRVYYSKAVTGRYQRKLSRELANVWKSYSHQSIWNHYAVNYNATGGDLPFLSWLLQSLGIVSTDEDPAHLPRNVEDVFLDELGLRVMKSHNFLF